MNSISSRIQMHFNNSNYYYHFNSSNYSNSKFKDLHFFNSDYLMIQKFKTFL